MSTKLLPDARNLYAHLTHSRTRSRMFKRKWNWLYTLRAHARGTPEKEKKQTNWGNRISSYIRPFTVHTTGQVTTETRPVDTITTAWKQNFGRPSHHDQCWTRDICKSIQAKRIPRNSGKSNPSGLVLWPPCTRTENPYTKGNNIRRWLWNRSFRCCFVTSMRTQLTETFDVHHITPWYSL